MAGGRAGVADLRGPRLLNKAVKLSAADLKAALVREAETLGFDCIGVTDPDAIGDAGKYFREFLDAGAHGDMDWLAAQPERRVGSRGVLGRGGLGFLLRLKSGPSGRPAP